MDILLIWAILAYYLFVIKPWLLKRNSNPTDRLNLMSVKDYLYEKIDFVNCYDIGSTFSRGDYTVNYQIIKNNGFVGEKLVICNLPLKGRSHEIVIEYLNGDVVGVKLNNQKLNPQMSPDNYKAAHKILELGQHSYKGETIP